MTGWRFPLPFLLICINLQAEADYWTRPVPPQDPAPPPPESCAVCHPDKYADWSGSRHALAFSPGLLGQIVDYAEEDTAACLSCHAPLADQQSPLLQIDLETLAADPDGHRPDLLARHGVFCGACHLREGILNAPSLTPSSPETRVHREVRIEPLMGDSRFCAPCHQFDQESAVNGKPLQDTYREWLQSPYPAQGRTCQACHMPERAHRFRGIHDPETVRRGLDITTGSTATAAHLEIRSTGVGHRFPTYMVPRVTLSGTLLDQAGLPIPGGTQEKLLQRQVTMEDGHWIEHSDTRLEPGAAETLRIPWLSGSRCAGAIRFRIEVDPEWYYHEKVYPVVLDEVEEGTARALIKQAKRVSESQRYILFEATLDHECADNKR